MTKTVTPRSKAPKRIGKLSQAQIHTLMNCNSKPATAAEIADLRCTGGMPTDPWNTDKTLRSLERIGLVRSADDGYRFRITAAGKRSLAAQNTEGLARGYKYPEPTYRFF